MTAALYPRGALSLPFRVGATSYVVPAGLRENLEWLADKVDDMQILLFDHPGCSNLPTPAEVAELAAISRDRGISLSVHLPGQIELGASDAGERRASAELFRRCIGLTEPLEPDFWVFHAGAHRDSYSVDGLPERASEALGGLIGLFDTPRRLAIENVMPDYDIEEAMVLEHDTSSCIDIGHLALYDCDIEAHIERWLDRCPAVHLHAVTDGRDHQSLARFSPNFIRHTVKTLTDKGFRGTMTMEVFEREDFDSSAGALTMALL